MGVIKLEPFSLERRRSILHKEWEENEKETAEEDRDFQREGRLKSEKGSKRRKAKKGGAKEKDAEKRTRINE